MSDQQLERRSGKSLDLGWCRITRVGLNVLQQPTMEEWETLGQTLATLESGIAWLVGDWLNTGETTFGEMASQVIDAQEWSSETVRVYRWVCAKVPPENRQLGTFAHCQVVAGLEPPEQREWLERAAKGDGDDEGWSSGRLKSEMLSSSNGGNLEYLVTVGFDSPAPRDILAAEYERAGRPVRKHERKAQRKRDEL